MGKLTFPDQQQDLQNAADGSLAIECDRNVKFPNVASGSRFSGDLAVERGSGHLRRFNPGCEGFGPTCRLPSLRSATGSGDVSA